MWCHTITGRNKRKSYFLFIFGGIFVRGIFLDALFLCFHIASSFIWEKCTSLSRVSNLNPLVLGSRDKNSSELFHTHEKGVFSCHAAFWLFCFFLSQSSFCLACFSLSYVLNVLYVLFGNDEKVRHRCRMSVRAACISWGNWLSNQEQQRRISSLRQILTIHEHLKYIVDF